MPMGMENRDIISGVALVVTWGLTFFGLGKRQEKRAGALDTRVSTLERELKHLSEVDMAKIHDSIDKLYRCFVDHDGEQRLVSFNSCDKVQLACQTRMDERHVAIDKRMQTSDRKLDQVLAELAEIRTTVRDGFR